MTDLDTLIMRGAASADVALDGLEDGVWSRVDQARSKARDRSLRLAALGVAAVIGGVAGGMTAPAIEGTPSELSIFSPRMAATPLDVRSALG